MIVEVWGDIEMRGIDTSKVCEKAEIINAYFFNTIKVLRGRGKNKLVRESVNKGTAHVVMNGPSLEESKGLIKDIGGAVMMVNSAYKTLLFKELSPDYLCFADPYFLLEDSQYHKELTDYLLSSGYRGTLILPETAYECFGDLACPKLYISNFVTNSGYDNRIKRLLIKNMISPNYVNVSILALYAAIQMGYTTIYLHGMDFSYIKDCSVDHNNNISGSICHYWEKIPSNFNSLHGDFNMKDHIESYYYVIRTLYLIEKYALDTGVKIYNMSPNSFLDMFVKYKL